jgi:hypothetical protein
VHIPDGTDRLADLAVLDPAFPGAAGLLLKSRMIFQILGAAWRRIVLYPDAAGAGDPPDL